MDNPSPISVVITTRFRLLLILMSFGMVLSTILVAQASHGDDPDIADIVVSFPSTYANCIDEETTDSVSITNVGTRYLRGQIIVQYVVDGGRQEIETILVAGVGDFQTTITYPPVSQWLVQSNGAREIHVDVSIEVFDVQGGELLGTLGPAHDWDVFCIFDVPTPTPTPVPPTPTPTATATPTSQLEINGCTPGYWRQDHHLDSWANYAPSDLFDTVFGVDDSADRTLLEAVRARGGGENALQRHAVAAVLNAASASVTYAYTESEVIAMVQHAYASGDFESTKDLFDAANNASCPLN